MRLACTASGLALTLLALSAPPVFARCDPATEPDRTDVATARAAVLANCDCAGAESHGAYVRCAIGQIDAVLVNRQCRRKAKACAAKSTCGRPGAVTCCKEKAGRTRCRIARSAGACEAKGGTPGSCSSCCDACPEPGSGPSCPVSSTTTTSTAPSTTLDTTTVTVTTTTVTTEPADFHCCLRTVTCGAFDTCEEMTSQECQMSGGFPGGPGGCDVPAPCAHATTTTPPSACCVGDQCIVSGFCECVSIHHGTFMIFQNCRPDLCATTTTVPMTLLSDPPSLR
jgi:hypothetical protein